MRSSVGTLPSIGANSGNSSFDTTATRAALSVSMYS